MNKNISYGGWIMLGNPQIAEIMNQSGLFDFIVVDMQHSTITSREMENVLSRITCDKYVRVMKYDESLICQALDSGCNHIIIPNVMSVNDIVINRSYGLYRSKKYGFDKASDKNHRIIAQIEYPLSNDTISDIFRLVDGYMIGPYDMKKHGGTRQNEIDYLNIAKQLKISKGYHLVFPTKELIKEKIKMGYDFIALGTDCIAIGEWCKKWKLVL